MKHYLDLVSISAKVHRRQSKMTRICIILAVFLVAVMFGLADMYLRGMTQKQLLETGDWHYQISFIDNETAALIAARPEVEISGWHTFLSSDAGYSFGGQTVAVSVQEQKVFEDILLNTLTDGSYPNADNEIAVPATLKTTVSLGNIIEIVRPDGSVASFTIAGFLDDSGMARLGTSAGPVFILTEGGLRELAPGSIFEQKFMLQLSPLCNMPETISDIKAWHGLAEEQVSANEVLLSIEGQLQGSSINQIYQVAFILAVIVMITCILMISSSLNSNVAQRTEFFGMMRCLGATKRQVMRFVRREGLYWCRTAIPMGLALSVVIVWVLSAAMRVISFQWFAYMPAFGISWISIVISTLLGILTVLLAMRTPAKRAAKVSPLEAVSGSTQQGTSFRKAANTRSFKIEIALGVHHARAKKKNYFLMTGAFAICIILFLTFSALVSFIKNAFMPAVWEPDLSIASETNTCSIGHDLLEQVSQNNAIERVYGRMFAYDVPALIGGEAHPANVISYEENQFNWVRDSLMEGSIDAVMQGENQVLFVYDESIPIHTGDSITLSINNEERTVTVAGVLSESSLARIEGTETIFCSEKTFTGLTGATGYTILDIQFKNKATEKDVAAVESIFADSGVSFTNNLSAVQQQRKLYYAFAVLVYGFLSIIVAITVFHIMNTISMSVSARMKQFGAMRAIGMSDRQLAKMIIAEAATYAVSGSVIGCIIGVPMHWVVFVSLITNIWGSSWCVPVATVSLIVGVVLFSTLLAVRSPVKRLHEMSIVENIITQ